MSIHFIFGGSGSGKTTYIINEIQKEASNMSDFLILVVPEQFTLQAERNLCLFSDVKGILNAQVLSFKRMAHLVFSKCGIVNKKSLSKPAKMMLLQKILLENQKDLSYFEKSVNKNGFVDFLGQTITEFFASAVSPLNVASVVELSAPNLYKKYNDISLIWGKYLDYIKSSYLSSDEELDFLAEKIEDSHFIHGAKIWIDGFSGFTAQEIKVISALVQYKCDITVSLTVDELSFIKKQPLFNDFFYETKRTYIDILKAIGEKTKITHTYLDKNKRQQNAPDLLHLESQFLKYCPKIYTGEIENISVFSDANRFDEVIKIARIILSLVRDQGYRFREIAILTRGVTEYEKIIRDVFNEYDIPFFCDTKKSIITHPVVRFISQALEIIASNWSYDSVFGCLKTGMTQISIGEIDNIENYCLAYGIKGNKWLMEWEYGFESGLFKKEDIINTKVKLLEILAPLSSKIKRSSKTKIRVIITAIYDFLESSAVVEKLSNIVSKLDSYNDILAGMYKQILTKLSEIFEKMNEIFGEDSVSVNTFLNIFNAGLQAMDMGLTPCGLDQIIVGDIERSRLPQVRVLFVPGANDGVLPAKNADQSLVTDTDKLILEPLGIHIGSSGRNKVFFEQFLIYNTLATPSNKLFISFSRSDNDGHTMRPSVVIGKIKKIFPELLITENSNFNVMDEICVLKPAVSLVYSHLRDYANGLEIDSEWLDVYSYALKSNEKVVSTAVAGMFETNIVDFIKPKTAEKIYGKTLHSSVSRLERFVSCPFSYFAQYTLSAGERRMYKLITPDIGVYFHKIIDEVSKEFARLNLSFIDVTKQHIDTAVEEATNKMLNDEKQSILISSPKNKYLVSKLKRISKRAIHALSIHVKAGVFEPLGFEIGFGANEKLPPIVIALTNGERLLLSGKIDRVDVFTDDKKTYVKIIDYKSGGRKFDLLAVYYGIQLQLMLYLDAFIKDGKALFNGEVLPGGVFYFRIDDPIINSVMDMSDDEIERLVLKELKMSGLVLNDTSVINALDSRIDGFSSIIPVRLNKSGEVVSSSSSVAAIEEFQGLLSFVNKKVVAIGDDIISGNIKVSPLVSQSENPCAYCIYKAACRFDGNTSKSKSRRVKMFTKNEIWDYIVDNHDTKM